MMLSRLGSPLHPLYPGFKSHGEISTIHDVSVLTIEFRRQKMNSGDGWFGCCHSTAKHGGLLEIQFNRKYTITLKHKMFSGNYSER